MTTKCLYFDKGYCKNKTGCSQRHPPLDCEGQCEDKIQCPRRHRVKCKNGNSCIYFKSNCCEYIHIENGQHDNSDNSIEHLQSLKEHVETKLTIIEAKLVELDATTYDIKTLESKYTIIVNNLESRVKLLEDQIKQERISNTKKVVQPKIINNDQHNEPIS